jgi:ribosomal protein L37AE/L43A
MDAPAGSDFRCPVCKQRASHVRVRHLANGDTDVWTCNDPKCSNHALYFYIERSQ